MEKKDSNESLVTIEGGENVKAAPPPCGFLKVVVILLSILVCFLIPFLIYYFFLFFLGFPINKWLRGLAIYFWRGGSETSGEDPLPSQGGDTCTSPGEDSRGGTPQSGEGVGAPQSNRGVGTPLSGERVRAPQSGEGVEAPQSGEALRAPQSDRGVGTPQSGEGVEAPQSDRGVGTPQSGEGVEAPQSDRGVGTPQSSEALRAPQSDRGVGTPQSGERVGTRQSDGGVRASPLWNSVVRPLAQKLIGPQSLPRLIVRDQFFGHTPHVNGKDGGPETLPEKVVPPVPLTLSGQEKRFLGLGV
jgi:hypothetical protein